MDNREIKIELSEANRKLLQSEDRCDKYDYIAAVVCGAIGGMIDIFGVGSPGDSALGTGSSAIIRYYCYIPCTSTLLQATACHTFHTLYVLSFLICY